MLNLIFSNLYNFIYLIRHADKTYLYDKTLCNIYIYINIFLFYLILYDLSYRYILFCFFDQADQNYIYNMTSI